MNTFEKQILDDAAEALRKVVGQAFKVTADQETGRLYLGEGNDACELNIEVKARLTRNVLGAAVHHLPNEGKNTVIVTRYVTPQVADELKEKLGVQFLDTAGNAYINRHPWFIYTKGNKPVGREIHQPQARHFQTAGLKVLFALFCDLDLVNAPYTKIAEKAGVAPATLTLVFRGLKEQGYLIEDGMRGQRRLINKGKLLRHWVEAFNNQLRPKQVIKKLRPRNGADRDWWKAVDLREQDAWWGGEVAAAKLTNHLVPAHVTLYKAGQLAKLQLMYGLEEDPGGTIEIVKPFWGTLEAAHKGDMVHPLLVYADLLATNDPRNIETAEMIYEQELTRLIGEE